MTNEVARYHLAPDGFGGITADPDNENGPWVKWAVVGPEIDRLRGLLVPHLCLCGRTATVPPGEHGEQCPYRILCLQELTP